MGQYTPMYKAKEYNDINRKLKPIEYKIVSKAMLDMGIENGYYQELDSAFQAIDVVDLIFYERWLNE